MRNTLMNRPLCCDAVSGPGNTSEGVENPYSGYRSLGEAPYDTPVHLSIIEGSVI